MINRFDDYTAEDARYDEAIERLEKLERKALYKMENLIENADINYINSDGSYEAFIEDSYIYFSEVDQIYHIDKNCSFLKNVENLENYLKQIGLYSYVEEKIKITKSQNYESLIDNLTEILPILIIGNEIFKNNIPEEVMDYIEMYDEFYNSPNPLSSNNSNGFCDIVGKAVEVEEIDNEIIKQFVNHVANKKVDVLISGYTSNQQYIQVPFEDISLKDIGKIKVTKNYKTDALTIKVPDNAIIYLFDNPLRMDIENKVFLTSKSNDLTLYYANEIILNRSSAIQKYKDANLEVNGNNLLNNKLKLTSEIDNGVKKILNNIKTQQKI